MLESDDTLLATPQSLPQSLADDLRFTLTRLVSFRLQSLQECNRNHEKEPGVTSLLLVLAIIKPGNGLYSLSRLNVATSHARCASILVANPTLFEPEC